MLEGGEVKTEENLGDFILHHLKNSDEWNIFGYHLHLPKFEPVHLLGIKIDLSITNHVVMIWIASIILISLFLFLFRKKKEVPGGFASVLEMFVLFIRDEVAVPNMGVKAGKSFTPFLSTIFFFILTCNLMGLFPLFSTATSNINVTAALALITFFSVQIAGMVRFGIAGYFKSMLPHGVPFVLNFIIFPIEFFGLFTKPFALAMRLFANMLAGHTVIFALLGLIIALGSVLVSPFAVGFAVFIDLLELLVAFIQAYIFTILSALFIGMAMNPEH